MFLRFHSGRVTMALRIITRTLHVYTSTLRIDTYYLRFWERYKNSRNTSIIHIKYDNLLLFKSNSSCRRWSYCPKRTCGVSQVLHQTLLLDWRLLRLGRGISGSWWAYFSSQWAIGRVNCRNCWYNFKLFLSYAIFSIWMSVFQWWYIGNYKLLQK